MSTRAILIRITVTVSAAGHVTGYDDPLDTAERELEEEVCFIFFSPSIACSYFSNHSPVTNWRVAADGAVCAW